MSKPEAIISTQQKKTSFERSLDESFQRLGKKVSATQSQHESQVSIDDKLKQSVGKMVRIPLNLIHLNENVRERIDTESPNFKALLSSIRKHGIQQNVVVELREIEGSIKLVCISGHRRITAARMVESMSHVPALIQQYEKESHKLELALAENMLREELHSLDIANVFRRLIDHGLTREDLAHYLGKSDKTIRYYLKMSEWSEKIQEFIRQHEGKFPARVLMNKFACRKYVGEDELMNALHSFVNGAKTPLTSNRKKEILTKKLHAFMTDKDYPSTTKTAIIETFEHCKLI